MRLDMATSAPLSVRIKAQTIERSLIIVALVIYGTSILQILAGGENSQLVRMIYVVMYVAGGLACILRYPSIVLTVTRAPSLALLMCFPVLSVLWSVNRDETLERSIAVLGPSMLAVYVGSCFSLKSIVGMVASSHLIIALLSLGAIVAFPSVGVTPEGEYSGALRGVHGHKNGLGAAAAFGAIALIFAFSLYRGARRMLIVFGLVLNLAFLALSESLTAQLALVFAFGAVVFGVRAWWPRVYLALLAALGILGLYTVLAVAEFGLGSLTSAVGRSSTMSNRMPLWLELAPVLEQRLWWGYGYAAFWETRSAELTRIAINLQFMPHYSHNGLIELMLDGGALLVGLSVTVLLSSIIRALRMAQLSSASNIYPLAFFLAFIFSNLTEAVFLARNSLIWMEFVMLSASCAVSVSIKISPWRRWPLSASADRRPYS